MSDTAAAPWHTTEIPLTGGNASGPVVKVGATVRKQATPQASTINRLLNHVRRQGVQWVPRAYGMDSQGRQVLEYLEGDVGHGDPPLIREEHVLVEIAQALRQWHDATTSFPRSDDDVWFWPPGRPPQEVIAHGDFAPYNHVFRDGHFVGAIDYDVCYPAPRLWDLAWTAYRYVPLTPPVDAAVDDGADADRSPYGRTQALARLERFLDAYGPVEHEADAQARPYNVGELLAWLPDRLHSLAQWGEHQESIDHQRWALMYRAHAHWVSSGGFAGPTAS